MGACVAAMTSISVAMHPHTIATRPHWRGSQVSALLARSPPPPRRGDSQRARPPPSIVTSRSASDLKHASNVSKPCAEQSPA